MNGDGRAGTPPARGPDEARAAGLHVLAVDDEAPALEDLRYQLLLDRRVDGVTTASDGADALRVLEHGTVDALFCDIRMPGLDGLDLARVLARFATPPPVVFVTAYDRFAVEAFDVHAVDYVLKPVGQERLAEAVRRVVESVAETITPSNGGQEDEAPDGRDDSETIAVELGGVTRFVRRADVRWVEAQGDYARLHTSEGSHLVRVPLTTLEEQWARAGFVRIHRSHLVSLAHVVEVRTERGRCTVRVGDAQQAQRGGLAGAAGLTELTGLAGLSGLSGLTELTVSRRHTRALRDRLVRLSGVDHGDDGGDVGGRR